MNIFEVPTSTTSTKAHDELIRRSAILDMLLHGTDKRGYIPFDTIAAARSVLGLEPTQSETALLKQDGNAKETI